MLGKISQFVPKRQGSQKERRRIDLKATVRRGALASPRARGEADARSAAGEGLSRRIALVDRAPHPNPLPAKSGEREDIGERNK